jgi:two-component system response regulator RegA
MAAPAVRIKLNIVLSLLFGRSVLTFARHCPKSCHRRGDDMQAEPMTLEIQDTVLDEDPATILGEDRSLLLADDDKPFLTRLARAMEARGFAVATADSVASALVSVRANPPAYAVLDMRLGDGNGLDIVDALRSRRPDAKMVILTGYGNIATAVTAVKLGAVDYLAKPADADDVFAALTATANDKPTPPENPMSADRVRWEHIQRVYEACERNVSETARRLNMHRRTLQRILAKRAPK